MPDNKPETQELEQKIDDLTKRADRAEAVAALPADHRPLFDSLDTEGQDEFLAKSADERESLVKAAAEDNAVVYTAEDGTEFRKSDDPRLVQMAKDRDEDRKTTREALAKVDNAELEKRAESICSNYPGSLAERAQLLRAAEAQGEEAVAQLRAGNEALKAAFARNGTSDQGESDSDGTAQGELDAMVSKRAKEDGIDTAQAYVKVLETEEGKALYARTCN